MIYDSDYKIIAFGWQIISNDIREEELINPESKPFVPLGIFLLPSNFTATFMNEKAPKASSAGSSSIITLSTAANPITCGVETAILVFTKRVLFFSYPTTTRIGNEHDGNCTVNYKLLVLSLYD